MTIAAERLIRRHGEGRLLLSPMISDFLAVMRDEHLSMPPDLLLIFKALLTIDGVLLGIQPEFNLTQALKRAACKIIHQRFSTDHLSRLITAIGWEAGAIGNDAPRLIRAAIRRLEDETGRQGAHEAIVRAIHRSGRNIAAAISVASLIIAAAIILQ